MTKAITGAILAFFTEYKTVANKAGPAVKPRTWSNLLRKNLNILIMMHLVSHIFDYPDETQNERIETNRNENVYIFKIFNYRER